MINKEDPKLKSGEFGLMDLNLGYFLPAIESGWEIIGLPVFSKRKPIYQLIFCHADAAIRSPQDLAGKRIGSVITSYSIHYTKLYDGISVFDL